MADSVEGLRARRATYVVHLQSIIKEYGKDASCVFLCFEGKDSDYYRPRVSAVLYTSKLSFMNCEGKNNLKPLYRAVRGNLSLEGARMAFFFDRDYELDLAEITADDTFVTSGYSIENYYTSSKTLRSMILSIVFSDIALEPDEEIWLCAKLRDYEAVRADFLAAVQLFNRWARAQRVAGESGKIDLDAFKVGIYLKLDFDQCSVNTKYDLDVLNSLAPERRPITADEIRIQERWFAGKNLALCHRGKQEADFLFFFVSRIIEDVNARRVSFSAKKKVTKRVSRKDIIFDLSAYAETDPALIDFLLARKARWLGSLPAS